MKLYIVSLHPGSSYHAGTWTAIANTFEEACSLFAIERYKVSYYKDRYESPEQMAKETYVFLPEMPEPSGKHVSGKEIYIIYEDTVSQYGMRDVWCLEAVFELDPQYTEPKLVSHTEHDG